jgi:hypothetical protein
MRLEITQRIGIIAVADADLAYRCRDFRNDMIATATSSTGC